MSQEKKPQEVKLQIQLDDDTAQGIYANLAVINHSDAEFCIDFIFVQPQQPRAKVRSRIILSPSHAKRLLVALHENVRKYEQQHGTIEVGSAGGGETVGEYH